MCTYAHSNSRILTSALFNLKRSKWLNAMVKLAIASCIITACATIFQFTDYITDIYVD